VAELGAKYREAVLWVLEGNARARSFYQAHGWWPDGAVKTEQRGEALLNEVRYRRRVGPSLNE